MEVSKMDEETVEVEERDLVAHASDAPAQADRPRWDVRTISLATLAVLAVLCTMYFVRQLLFPIVLAVILNLLLSPAVRYLARHRIPEWIGGAVVIVAVLLIVGLAMFRLIEPASRWVASAPDDLRQIEWELRSLRKPIEDLAKAGEQVEELADADGEDDESVPVKVKEARLTNTVLSTTGNVLAGAFLTIVLLYFLLAPGDRFLHKMVEVVPKWKDKRTTVELLRGIERGVGRYLLSITCINIALGFVIAAAMWAVGMPNPILWGVMATTLNFIPYVGAMVGTIVVFLVGVVSFDTLGHALWPPVLYMTISAVEGSFVTPAILGRSMRMNPVMILISLAFWGWMWGVGGALLAVPILAMAKITCDHIPSLQPVGRFLED